MTTLRQIEELLAATEPSDHARRAELLFLRCDLALAAQEFREAARIDPTFSKLEPGSQLVACSLTGHHQEALRIFASLDGPPANGALLDGLAITAAMVHSCLALGDLVAAPQHLECSPPIGNLEVPALLVLSWASRAFMQAYARDATLQLYRVLVSFDETIKAKKLLDEVAPAVISHTPEVQQLRRTVARRLRHVSNWQEFKACYATTNPSAYYPEDALYYGKQFSYRARRTREWAEQLPKDGPPIQVLSVGGENGATEAQILTANPRINLTWADASAHAERAAQLLVADFPGRVTIHRIDAGHYDWPSGPFDVIMMFEVLEHLPDDRRALLALRDRLAANGTLFLSTPVAAYAFTGKNTQPEDAGFDWWGHFRAHNPTSFWRLLRSCGLDGTLFTGANFFAEMRRVELSDHLDRVAVCAPHGVPGDLVTALSEFEVDAYGPQQAGDDEVLGLKNVLVGRNRVHYRQAQAFDSGSDEYRAVVFCPGSPPFADAPYAKFFWVPGQTATIAHAVAGQLGVCGPSTAVGHVNDAVGEGYSQRGG